MSHFMHLNGFSLVWVLSCSFKELDLKTLFTFVHLNGFSPLCGSTCYQVTSCLEALFTLCALEWLLSRVGPLMFLQVASYYLNSPILRSSCHISSIRKASLLCGSSLMLLWYRCIEENALQREIREYALL